MRTLDEIKRDVRHAASIKNVAMLMQCAQELDEHAHEHAHASALATQARGIVLTIHSEFSKALEHYERALALYEELSDQEGIAALASNVGLVKLYTNEYASALAYFHRALKINVELKDVASEATVACNIGIVHVYTGDNRTGLEYYNHSLACYEKVGDRNGVARVTGNIGKVHANAGDHIMAMYCYQKALAIHEELGDMLSTAFICTSIGSLHVKVGDHAIALQQFDRALSIHQEYGSRSGVAYDVTMIANLYFVTGAYPVALEQAQRALALYEELDDLSGQADAICIIASIYWATGEYAQAHAYNRRALSMYEDLGRINGVVTSLLNIGNEYLRTEDHTVALEYYHKALAVNERNGDFKTSLIIRANIISANLSLGFDAEAEKLLDALDALHIDTPEECLLRDSNRAKLQERQGNYEAASMTLRRALTQAAERGLRSQEAELHRDLRDLAQLRNDFAAYIEHNNEFSRITEEIRGREATQRLAMMEADRKVEGERREREKERALLYGALPRSVADRMLRGEKVTGDHYDEATVIFADIVGFTTMSDRLPPGEVVLLLERMFSAFDAVCELHNVTKIKTIGDSYMAVAFPSDTSPQHHVIRAAQCALDMLHATSREASRVLTSHEMSHEVSRVLTSHEVSREAPLEVTFRIGMHCGPVTAGVIGTQRLQYDVWGDTVNVASRMESSGLPGRVHITEAIVNAMENQAIENREYGIEERGEIDVKGKGLMRTYWLMGDNV